MPSEIDYRLMMPPESSREGRAIGERPLQKIDGIDGGPKEAAFGQELGNALKSLDTLQVQADQEADAVANGGGNLHEVALAFEKADVAMRLATRIRNKLVETYNDIMRMSV